MSKDRLGADGAIRWRLTWRMGALLCLMIIHQVAAGALGRISSPRLTTLAAGPAAIWLDD